MMLDIFKSKRLAAVEARLHEFDAQLRIADAIFHTTQPVMVADAYARILRVNEAFYAAMLDTIGRTGQWAGEVWDRRKNGGVFPKWMTITVVRDAGGAEGGQQRSLCRVAAAPCRRAHLRLRPGQ